MPRLEDPWSEGDAQIIDITAWKAARDLKAQKADPTPEYIDKLIRRAYLHTHPHATKGEFRRWLAETEDEDNPLCG
jgi:hypothetical protein